MRSMTDEGYREASLQAFSRIEASQDFLRNTPHPTFAMQTNLCSLHKFAAAKATFSRKGRRMVLFAALLTLIPTPAFACSCMRIAPEGFRQQAAAIIEGRVTGVKREGGINGRLIARIAVSRVVKGQTPKTVTVTTRGNSAACGVGFHPGHTGEFLLARDNGRYATNLCLMLGARR
jgi:hypothetical protein